MIRDSIEYLVSKIQSLGLFENVYSLVEIVTNAEGRSYPAVYTGNGKYSIIHYSFNNGTAYIRKNGQMIFSEYEVNNYVGCETYSRVVIPLMLLTFKQKNKLPIDCSYTEDLLAETIISYIANNTKDAKQSLNVKQFKITFNSINTDSASVWQNETSNIEQNDINFDIACVAFDMNIEMVVDPKCIENICEPIIQP
jgi:hypothetical protein